MTRTDQPTTSAHQVMLTGALSALVEEFAGTFAPETVAECLEDSYERLLPASVSSFLPLLAQRFTRERLRAAVRAADRSAAPRHGEGEGRPSSLVLFVCTANSGRSQLAAALLAHRSAGEVQVASAGTTPGAAVQSEVALVLDELGIDTGELFPKPLTDEVVAGADVVVTMGCGDSCPVLSGRRYLDWGVADPQGRDLEAVRRIRDDIDARVVALLDDLLVDPQAPAAPAAR